MTVITYDDTSTDYDESTEFYDGFDPAVYKSVKPFILAVEDLKSALSSDNLKPAVSTSNPN